MPLEKLRQFLDANNIKYELLSHSRAYTAQEIASRAHIPGQELAKTVMLKIDNELAMAVLPASEHVDVAAIKAAIIAQEVRLATEFEFKDSFPNCEVGAMPPFGNLYGMRVFVDEDLAKDEEIAFNAGSHTELMRLAYEDFVRLVKPQMMKFSMRRARRAAAAAAVDRLW